MKKSTKTFIGILALIIVVIIIVKLIQNADASPGKYDVFAQCVTDSGAKMYGAYWCPHCQNQKEEFGTSWKFINYVECDARGDNANPAACEAAGITGYPTWIFGNGERVPGEVALEEIAFRTNCTLHD